MSTLADVEIQSGVEHKVVCDVLDEVTKGMASVREVVKSLQLKKDATSELDVEDGISLLSLKHHLMLSYLQSLALVSSRRTLGHSLAQRSPPTQPFGTENRDARGGDLGDRVDSMIEGRLILEKIKALEGRMRYQIDKLVRVAEEAPSSSQNIINDPLAFRPNPQNLMNADAGSDDEKDHGIDSRRDGIYHPPRLAPVPYTDVRMGKAEKTKRVPVPNALTSLEHLDPSRPHIESATGLGSTPAHSSTRARELQRMTQFEEDNFTRLVMKKKDAKRRKQDEADVALGGLATGRGRGGSGALQDEFGDIFRSVGRSRKSAVGDGYEDLRQRAKKEGVLERSRARGREEAFGDDDEGPDGRKKSRFEKEVKAAKKRMSAKRKVRH